MVKRHTYINGAHELVRVGEIDHPRLKKKKSENKQINTTRVVPRGAGWASGWASGCPKTVVHQESSCPGHAHRARESCSPDSNPYGPDGLAHSRSLSTARRALRVAQVGVASFINQLKKKTLYTRITTWRTLVRVGQVDHPHRKKKKKRGWVDETQPNQLYTV